MPEFPLGDVDIANVLTYVYDSFENAGLQVQADEVKLLRTQPSGSEGRKLLRIAYKCCLRADIAVLGPQHRHQVTPAITRRYNASY